MRPLQYWIGWAALVILIIAMGAPMNLGRAAAREQHAAGLEAALAPRGNAAELAVLVDQLLTRQLAEAHIPGASVAVVKGGRLLMTQGCGREGSRPPGGSAAPPGRGGRPAPECCPAAARSGR